MPRKKTHDEYIKELSILKPEFECLETYKGSKVKILHRHKICGYEWKIKLNVLLSSGECGCPFCSGKVRKDINYFKNEVKNLVDDEYSVVGDYINTHTKTSFKHNICGNIFDMTPHNFLSGQRCPECQHGSKRKTTEEFKEELFELVGDEYTLEDEYITNKTKVNFRHKLCDKLWYAAPDEILSGYRCSHCYGNNLLTQEEFEQRIFEQRGDEYSVISEYINSASKIKIRHNKCGCIWDANARDVLYNMSGRPRCNQSKGESRIERFLSKECILYIPQMKYDNLVGKKNIPLSYDFYLPLYNLLIEYQGQQHEKPVDWFGGENKFKRQLEIDEKKKEYAKNNSINLLEIWYYDFNNIEEILRSRLSKQSAFFI